ACLADWKDIVSEGLNELTPASNNCKIYPSKNFHFRLDLSKTTITKSFKLNIYPNFPYFACYGSSRLDTYTESSSGQIQQSKIKNLFDSTSFLEDIEHQLSRWYAKKNDKSFNEKYQKTKQLLIDILQIKDIEIDFKTDIVTYIEQDKEGNAFEGLPLHQLASGYRSLIAMVGDMILKLFRTQPEILDPKELEGIVIIDELDLHFHPKWQKRLPQILTKHFPKIQFIASTHSPIPFLGAPKGSVFLTVNRSKETGITVERIKHLEDAIHKLTPNLLLNSPIFAYADLFSSRFKANQNIHTEDTFTEIAFNEQLEKSFLEELPVDKQNQLRELLKKK
ncbi:MAG: AAA family ATPase, partial [Saprospiraceae bacterium]